MFLITDSQLDEFCSVIRQKEENRQRLMQMIGSGEIWQKELVRVHDFDFRDLRVAGVDGGLGRFSLKGVECAVIRAGGAVFHYHGRQLEDVEYFPDEYPSARIVAVSEPLDTIRLDLLVGMERQIAEIECATEIVRSATPTLLVLDGSVLPQYTSRQGSSCLEAAHDRLSTVYEELHRMCLNRGVFLTGFVKESRSNLLVNWLVRESCFDEEVQKRLAHVCDSDLLEQLLPEGYRTRPLRIGTRWGIDFFAFYIRTARDRVFRVEFPELGGDPELSAACLASFIGFLCSFSDSVGVPSVLLEADLRVRVREAEVKFLRDSLVAALRGEPTTVVRWR